MYLKSIGFSFQMVYDSLVFVLQIRINMKVFAIALINLTISLGFSSVQEERHGNYFGNALIAKVIHYLTKR